MRIRNIGLQKEYDVYAIAVHTQEDWVFKDRVNFYMQRKDELGSALRG